MPEDVDPIPRQLEDPDAHSFGDYSPALETQIEVIATEPSRIRQLGTLAGNVLAGVGLRLKSNKDQPDYCPIPETAEDVLNMGLSKKHERIALAGVGRRLKVDKERLQYEVDHDELTGALKKKAFERAIEEDQRANPGASRGLIFIDLGNFKAVNALLGQAGGDEVLKRVVRLFKRGSDLVCRLGGDELVIYMDTSIDTPERSPEADTSEVKVGKRIHSASEKVAEQVARIEAMREVIVADYPVLDAGAIKFYIGAGGIEYARNRSCATNVAAAEKICKKSKAGQAKDFGAYREVDLSAASGQEASPQPESS